MLDIVVTNYRTPEDLVGFLGSLQTHRPSLKHTVTVVNVDPLDRDRLAARMAGGFTDRVIEHGWNCGYAYACNDAAGKADGDALVFFNADVVLTPGAIDECYRQLIEHEEWGVLGPRQYDRQRKITHAGIFGSRQHPAFRGWKHPDGAAFHDVREDAVTVSGSAYFIKRSTWDQLASCPIYVEATKSSTHARGSGAFLSTELFYEETWCSYHATEHGWKIVYYGPVGIVHNWHQSIRQNGMESDVGRIAAESRQLFRHVCDAHGIPHD